MKPITTDERIRPNQSTMNSELIEVIPNDQSDSQAEDDELENLELDP